MKKCICCGKAGGTDWCSACLTKVREGRGLKLLYALSEREKASLSEACKVEKKKEDELKKKKYEELMKSFTSQDEKQAETEKASVKAPAVSDTDGKVPNASIKAFPEAYVFSIGDTPASETVKTDVKAESDNKAEKNAQSTPRISDEEFDKILDERGLTRADLDKIVDEVLREEREEASRAAEPARSRYGFDDDDEYRDQARESRVSPWLIVLMVVALIVVLFSIFAAMPGVAAWILRIIFGTLFVVGAVNIVLAIIDWD